jgi:hypothetical protein
MLSRNLLDDFGSMNDADARLQGDNENSNRY